MSEIHGADRSMLMHLTAVLKNSPQVAPGEYQVDQANLNSMMSLLNKINQ